MTELLLGGLDGKNPLGFLAALGVLNVATDSAKPGHIPKLAWRSAGTWHPLLIDGPERDALLDVMVRDVESFASEMALDLRYRKKDSEAHDLKPPPSEYVRYLRQLLATGNARSLDFAAAFATDVARDNNENTKPTAFHFTAGQQEFLSMVTSLRDGLNREDFEEALFGPWRYQRALPVLQWDNSQARDYALRASDPSKEKKLGVPAADWLAFRGLPFLRVMPIGDQIWTTGCRGGWKTGAFRWPIWSPALPRSVIRSLVSSPELFAIDARTLAAREISVVLESGITRSDQGGYGSFSPASIASSARERDR